MGVLTVSAALFRSGGRRTGTAYHAATVASEPLIGTVTPVMVSEAVVAYTTVGDVGHGPPAPVVLIAIDTLELYHWRQR